jgi:hypothetical protein
VTPGEYAERNGKSKLRLTLRKIIDEWTKVTPPLSLRQFEQLKKECDEAIAKGEKAMKWSEGAINEMKVLRGRRSGEKFAKLRWQANYDLALAQLYKLRFMLRDYVAVLRETKTTGFPKPKPDAKFNCYIITFDRSFSKLLLGPPALKDWDQANKALEQVITDYDGTPWAEMAKLQKETLAPITIRPAYAITHGGYITISAE